MNHANLAPIFAMILVSSAMPPGLSLTVTTKRTSRPSAAKPLSKHLPRTVESMFPPQRATTTLQKTNNTSFKYKQCLKIKNSSKTH